MRLYLFNYNFKLRSFVKNLKIEYDPPFLGENLWKIAESTLISVDSRNFETWGQFPPMSEKCGGLVN